MPRWANPPVPADAKLMRLAAQNKLSQPAELKKQTARLLADARAERFLRDFTGQWLQTTKVGEMQPDKSLYPEYDEDLERAMVQETLAATGGKGANVVLDMVGGDYIAKNLKAVAMHGRIVMIAFQKGSRIEADWMPIMLKRLTFTGSTGVGKALVKQSADALLRTSMELGGNAPFLVFEDADLDAAVTGAMQAKMRNIGQACTAANRFIVHEAVADEFATKFAAKMAELNLGRGVADGTTCGPVINSAARANMERLVELTVKEGADVVVGGESVGDEGYFFKPTVLANVPADASILKEEIFGPIAPIVRFKTEEEAVRLANNTEYGLVSYAFTKDLARGMRLVDSLESGMSGLNTGLVSNAAAPFGGVKASGLGREGGAEGIEEYLETRYVLVPNL